MAYGDSTDQGHDRRSPHANRPLPHRPFSEVRDRPRLPSPMRDKRASHDHQHGPHGHRPHHRAPTNRRQERSGRHHRSRRDGAFEDPHCHSIDGRSEPGGGSGMPSWRWYAHVTAVISFTVFASVFGVVGLFLASLAYADHKVGEYHRSRFKLRISWACSIFGIIFTTTCFIVLLIAMYGVALKKPTFDYYEYFVPPWLLDKIDNKL